MENFHTINDAAFSQSAPRKSGHSKSFTDRLTVAVICSAGRHTESLKIKSVISKYSCLFVFTQVSFSLLSTCSR